MDHQNISKEEIETKLLNFIDQASDKITHDNLEEVLDKILKLLDIILKSEASSLFLLNTKTNILEVKAATGKSSQKVKRIKVGMGQGVAGWVAQNGESLFISDVNKDKRFIKEIPGILDFETTSIMCIPIKLNTNVIGIIEFLNNKIGSFTLIDQDFVEKICSKLYDILSNLTT